MNNFQVTPVSVTAATKPANKTKRKAALLSFFNGVLLGRFSDPELNLLIIDSVELESYGSRVRRSGGILQSVLNELREVGWQIETKGTDGGFVIRFSKKT